MYVYSTTYPLILITSCRHLELAYQFFLSSPLLPFLSHTHSGDNLPIHCPVWQRNSSALQSGQPASSLASGQSSCPSQRQVLGMQSLFEPAGAAQVKWSGPHAGTALHVRPSSSSTRLWGHEQTACMKFEPEVERDADAIHKWEQPPWLRFALHPWVLYIWNTKHNFFS